MHPGRKLGIILGLVILVAIFALPFGSSDTSTLYGTAGPLISDLGAVQSSGGAAAITYSYIVVIAFILLVIAGLVGLFPLGTGVLGVVGMAMITIAPYLVYPNGEVKLDPGVGFVVIWAASIISLGASFWHRKKSSGVHQCHSDADAGSLGAAEGPVSRPNPPVCQPVPIVNPPVLKLIPPL